MSLRYPFLLHTVLIALLFIAVVPLSAQELTGEAQVLEQDIKTSTLTELAAWCRELGLSEGGTRDNMAQRLRDYYGLHAQTKTDATTESKDRVITIESARTTEYFTLDTVNEEYARLRGGVVISLRDGDTTHRISAGEILYNRTRNIMSASGGVEYVRTKSDSSIETFKGESITVNLDTWSSVFLDGLTEKAMSASDSSYRFAGTVISRSDEDATIMRDAVISNGKDPEAYWSLDASRLWLLPGSDWLVLNALLKVGEIPVLWLPAFYFPADEVIFHPVLGTRSREGSFVQTTTYVWGRPQASSTSENSLSKIMGSGENMEKERNGLFLRSTGKKEVDPNTKRLSFILDGYANLGAYLGSELALPASGIFGALQVSAGLGFTRNVYLISTGDYSPFALYDGSTEWNSTYIFSNQVPFRYRLSASGSLKPGKYGSFSWVFPAYSDTFVDNDFMNRSEAMDWVKLLTTETTDETTTTTIKTIGEYSWRLNGAFTPNVSKANPYISSLAFSSISSSILFKPRTSTAILSPSVSPERIFFFPDKFSIFSISGSMTGTPLTLGRATKPVGKVEEEKEDKRFAGLHAPWDTPSKNDTTTQTPADMTEMRPPTLAQTFTLPAMGGPVFTISYGLTPSAALEQQFRSSTVNWPESEDIDWSEITSTRFRSELNSNISFNLTQPDTGLYSNTLRFSETGAWETYTYMNEEAEEYTTAGETDEAKMDTAWLNTYNASFFRTYYDWNTTIKPFFRSTMWANTNFQYAVKGLLAKSVFDGTAQDPSWDIEMGDWIKEDLDTNSVSANIAASVMDLVQSFTLSAILPPKDSQLSASATMRIWITETSVREDIVEPFDEEARIRKPIYFTETIKMGRKNIFTFQQLFTYDPELEEYTSVTSTLSGLGFSASFGASRTRSYYFDAGWKQSTDDEQLNPSSLRFSYSKTFSKKELWDKQLSFSTSFNTALSFDLQRYTYSSFTFGLNTTMSISRFIDVSLAANSENRELYRYFHNLGLPFFTLPIEPPVEKERNFFLDLLNSFRFDDNDLRRRSGFKLKSFTLRLLHHLGDWDATLSMTLSPYLDATTRSYKFNNEVSFLVQWKPITEIKSELYYNKEVLTLK
jgi:hypothetical protein